MMKITAGIGSIDDYIPFAEAGADEVFCGYIPFEWLSEYGNFAPLNRREVLYYNVQIGSRSELLILKQMKKHMEVPVTLTFNSPFYPQESFPLILKILEDCIADGFDSFIIADPVLLFYLHKEGFSKRCRIHISGEIGNCNHLLLKELRKLPASRIIFQRKTQLSDMETIIRMDQELHPDTPLEFEAFALNEMCHFHGAFCSSLHCDELTHMCHLPYRAGAVDQSAKDFAPQILNPSTEEEDDYSLGHSGCGLCALWRMNRMGITHLKLVSRGNYSEDTLRDIRGLSLASRLADECPDEASYQKEMKASLFGAKKCSGHCYYL